MTDNVLVLKEVTKRFGQLSAVDQLSFNVKRRKITALIGPNGAGKSTVFNLITGYLPLTSGSIFLEDSRIDQSKTYRISELGVARAFQIARPFRGVSVYNNVKVGALYGRSGSREVDSTIRYALKLVHLDDLADKLAAELTIGQLRRMELARAIATRPRVLLADEPLAGLNPTESEELIASLQLLVKEGMTILLVEHDMAAVMKISDHVVVLEAGRLIAQGEPKLIAHHPRVIEAYLGLEVA